MDITFEEFEILLRDLAEPSEPISSPEIDINYEFDEYDSDLEPPIYKEIKPAESNILILSQNTSTEFNITTKDKSGFITLHLSSQALIFNALNTASSENKFLPDDIKRIIFHKLLNTIINTHPYGINTGILYNTLVFRNIRVIDLDLPYFPTDSDDDSNISVDDENWYNGDE